MKIYFATKLETRPDKITVFEWEFEKRGKDDKKYYSAADDGSWFRSVKADALGKPNLDGSFGLTEVEAVDALCKAYIAEAERLETRARGLRMFVGNCRSWNGK